MEIRSNCSPINSILPTFVIGIKLGENFFRRDGFLINSNSKKQLLIPENIQSYSLEMRGVQIELIFLKNFSFSSWERISTLRIFRELDCIMINTFRFKRLPNSSGIYAILFFDRSTCFILISYLIWSFKFIIFCSDFRTSILSSE